MTRQAARPVEVGTPVRSSLLRSRNFGLLLATFSANAVLYNVATLTYRQRITPPALLGRVNAAFLWVCFGVIPLGALTGGTLASQLGLRPALWICVLGTWSAALFVVCSPLRRIRDMPAT
ncbi:hypothetical protein ACGF7U_09445 [Micromonospora sp. NPDC047670]|uniref:hypothetical protein n=1 Tax=Micromonospora sp. NPDC047670 TaxID=3364252 RepID=UPI0037185316